MFSKIKKYVIGFFVLAGGILFAFLSGKSAGRKDEKLKGVKSESKKINKRIKGREKEQKKIKKTLKGRKKALNDLKSKKNKGYKKQEVEVDEASKYLKSYLKNKKQEK
jgi:septal ring factor EnvC (AmiA/AmiB activator)